MLNVKLTHKRYKRKRENARKHVIHSYETREVTTAADAHALNKNNERNKKHTHTLWNSLFDIVSDSYACRSGRIFSLCFVLVCGTFTSFVVRNKQEKKKKHHMFLEWREHIVLILSISGDRSFRLESLIFYSSRKICFLFIFFLINWFLQLTKK